MALLAVVVVRESESQSVNTTNASKQLELEPTEECVVLYSTVANWLVATLHIDREPRRYGVMPS